MSLQKPALVLNKTWTPIRIKSLINVIKTVFKERASIVDGEDYSVYNWEQWIKLPVVDMNNIIMTTSGPIRLPRILILSYYDKIPNYSLRLTRRNLLLRDDHRCQYTGKKLKISELDVDHVIPKSKGGKTRWDNLVTCSIEANRKKSNMTPEEAGLKLLKKPKKPSGNFFCVNSRKDIPDCWSKFIDINRIKTYKPK